MNIIFIKLQLALWEKKVLTLICFIMLPYVMLHQNYFYKIQTLVPI